LKQGPYFHSHGLDLKTLKQNPHGIDLGPLQPCLPGRLFTADKKINLAPAEFLQEMQRVDRDLLADRKPPAAPEFDLLLIGRTTRPTHQ